MLKCAFDVVSTPLRLSSNSQLACMPSDKQFKCDRGQEQVSSYGNKRVRVKPGTKLSR